MRRQSISGFRHLSVIAIVFALAAIGLPPAPSIAAPGDPDPGSTALSLRSLGFGNAVSFYGLQGETTLVIPVPPGTTPGELTGTVELPPNLLRGTMTVMQGDRTIVRMPLPDADLASITIPLAGAQVVDNSVSLSLRSHLVPPPDYCLYDPTNPLRLTNVSIRLNGIESAPTDIADFLPPVLQRLTIYIPRSPSPVESDAAIRLTAAVAARYGQQHTAVTVMPLDGASTVPPVDAAPFERQIVVREDAAPGVALQGGTAIPSLLITGASGDVTNQVGLLTADLSRLAMSSKAIAGPLASAPQITTDSTTIRELGQPGVNATDLTNPRVSIPLDQTRLGRSTTGLRVHLQGSYTPLPATLGGQVAVRIGDRTIAHWSTDSGGSIDRWIDVPDDLVARYTSLDVEVQAAGNTGRCGEYAPIRLVIDGATTVESTLADPPVGLGFQSLPQALMPRIQVGIHRGDHAFADTVRAATIVEGLQRLSSRPLDTTAVPFDDALAAPNPAILIAADGWDRSSIVLPLSAQPTGPITVEGAGANGGPTTLTLDPGQPFGSLQTTYANGRTLLVATSNGSAAQLDSLLGWLDGDVQRWSALAGNVVVAMPEHDPVALNIELPQQQSNRSSGPPTALWWVAGGLLLAALAIGITVRTRKRSREPIG